jgi:hypothetical protein
VGKVADVPLVFWLCNWYRQLNRSNYFEMDVFTTVSLLEWHKRSTIFKSNCLGTLCVQPDLQ